MKKTMKATAIAAIYIMGVLSILGSGEPLRITPTPTGGSKGDAVVNMSYTVPALQLSPVEVQWSATRASAARRCQAWGYSSAERFGGEERSCNRIGYNGKCDSYLVTIKYQCIE